jgi:nicotinate-nucleotide pyrophosphorylase (carboxylating)
MNWNLEYITDLIRRALEEDVGAGDATSLATVPANAVGRCVALARSLRNDCVVEISGGITLENARAYAQTGADYLSSGALTHSAPVADLSLLVDGIEET